MEEYNEHIKKINLNHDIYNCKIQELKQLIHPTQDIIMLKANEKKLKDETIKAKKDHYIDHIEELKEYINNIKSYESNDKSVYDISNAFTRPNPVGASAIARDNNTVSRRGSFIRRHLFIPAGMITIGIGMLHREHIRSNDSIGAGPTPSPSAPSQHVACREGSSSPPIPPHRGGSDRGRSTRPP